MPNIGYGKLGERSVHDAQESGSRTQRNTGHASPRVLPLTRFCLRQDKRLVDVDRVLPRATARGVGGIADNLLPRVISNPEMGRLCQHRGEVHPAAVKKDIVE